MCSRKWVQLPHCAATVIVGKLATSLSRAGYMLREKLFDTSLYPSLCKTVRPQVIHEDFTGLYVEAVNRPLEERVNVRKFYIENREVVDRINQTLVKKVKECFSCKTEFLAKESRAAEEFWEHMVDADIGSVAMTISPSGGTSPYKDARINIGLKISEDCVEFYGIVTELSPARLLSLYNRLSKFSETNTNLYSPEELREVALLLNIPNQESPWDFLEEMLPLDSNVWQSIKKGLPWKIKKELSQETRAITQEMSKRLDSARSERQFISIGAWGERMMQEKGMQLLGKSCPGATNTDLLNLSNSPPSLIDVFGNTREVVWTYHIGNCIHCGAKNVEVGPCSICKACEKIL